MWATLLALKNSIFLSFLKNFLETHAIGCICVCVCVCITRWLGFIAAGKVGRGASGQSTATHAKPRAQVHDRESRRNRDIAALAQSIMRSDQFLQIVAALFCLDKKKNNLFLETRISYIRAITFVQQPFL